jgi:hypothetical protein
MFTFFDHSQSLDSYLQDDNVVLYAMPPPENRAGLEHLAGGPEKVDGSKVVKGILIALPVAALFWLSILWAVKSVFSQ